MLFETCAQHVREKESSLENRDTTNLETLLVDYVGKWFKIANKLSERYKTEYDSIESPLSFAKPSDLDSRAFVYWKSSKIVTIKKHAALHPIFKDAVANNYIEEDIMKQITTDAQKHAEILGMLLAQKTKEEQQQKEKRREEAARSLADALNAQLTPKENAGGENK